LKKLVAILISWGPLGLFLMAILDSAGIPLPAGVDAMLVILSSLNPASTKMYALLSIAGSLIGCQTLFLIGHQGGKLYLDKRTQEGKARQFREWFQKYGLWTVFVPALLPVPLPTKIFVLSAGALGVPALRFALVILVARTIRYFGLAYCGAIYGRTAFDYIKASGKPLGLALGLILAVILLIAWLRSPKKQK
jgi:membrane protein DedA with SNARE-associated domain